MSVVWSNLMEPPARTDLSNIFFKLLKSEHRQVVCEQIFKKNDEYVTSSFEVVQK